MLFFSNSPWFIFYKLKKYCFLFTKLYYSWGQRPWIYKITRQKESGLGNSVETIRLLHNPVIYNVWKYLAVEFDIFSLHILFPMSIICNGFPTNIVHFVMWSVGPTRFKENTKTDLLPTVGSPRLTAYSPRWATHGPRWAFLNWLSLSSRIR